MKKWSKIFLYILCFIMLLAFLMTFDWAAEPIANAIGKPVSFVRDTAKTVFYSALACFLIYAGVLSTALPLIAFILVGVGLAMLFMALKPYFMNSTSSSGQ